MPTRRGPRPPRTRSSKPTERSASSQRIDASRDVDHPRYDASICRGCPCLGKLSPSAAMSLDRGETSGNVTAVLHNRSLRRALIAFTAFRPTESAQWIAILVYAYGRGGSREVGLVAIGMLLPTAALAPFLAQIGDRVNRERALACAYLAIGVAAGLT